MRFALPLAISATLSAALVGSSATVTPNAERNHPQSPLTAALPLSGALSTVPPSTVTPAATASAAASGASGPSTTKMPTGAPTGSGSGSAPGGSGNAVTIFAFSSHSNPAGVVASLPKVVNGVSWIFGWKQIATAPGVYDWSTVDAAIAASSGSGRQTMLRIDAGATSPSWIPNQLTMSFQPLGPQPYQTVTMPRPWDPTYIADLTAFIKAYGARYDGNSKVTRIEMTGGGYQGEMVLPQWSGWIGAGYTDAAMTSTWETLIHAYRNAFPRHALALDYGEPLQVYYHSHIDPAVLAYAASQSNIDYQQNGLKSTTSENWSVFRTLLALSARTRIGWQLSQGGNSASVLLAAFKVAIASHASYVEVYRNDCVNPANAAALAYLARGGH
jgi:hypothetical protein